MFARAKYKSDQEASWQSLKNPVATLKRDGSNFWMVINSEGRPSLFSRRQSVKGDYPDRTSQLPHLASLKLPQFAGHTYNVELIHTGHDPKAPESHPKVSGILNSLPERAIKTQQETGPVRAVLINVLNPPLVTYHDKLLHMKEVEKAVGKPDILFVDNPEITREGIVNLINKTKAEGREGVIVTDLKVPGPMIKIKHANMMNLKVEHIFQEVDIHGNPKPSMGALAVSDASERLVGKVGTGFSREDRQEAWNEPEKWLGKLIQVKFRNIVREGGMIFQPSYNGEADGELDRVSDYRG